MRRARDWRLELLDFVVWLQHAGRVLARCGGLRLAHLAPQVPEGSGGWLLALDRALDDCARVAGAEVPDPQRPGESTTLGHLLIRRAEGYFWPRRRRSARHPARRVDATVNAFGYDPGEPQPTMPADHPLNGVGAPLPLAPLLALPGALRFFYAISGGPGVADHPLFVGLLRSLRVVARLIGTLPRSSLATALLRQLCDEIFLDHPGIERIDLVWEAERRREVVRFHQETPRWYHSPGLSMDPAVRVSVRRKCDGGMKFPKDLFESRGARDDDAARPALPWCWNLPVAGALRECWAPPAAGLLPVGREYRWDLGRQPEDLIGLHLVALREHRDARGSLVFMGHVWVPNDS
ncbi:MAG: hypothetical protein ABIO70_02970 [Pseudomonadota bacterium]